MTNWSVERLGRDGLRHLAEIDRSELVDVEYVQDADRLTARTVDERVPDWGRAGSGAHTVAALASTWQPVVDEGGPLFGVRDHGRMVGLALVRVHLRPQIARLALLHVTRSYRRRGVASALLAAAESAAGDAGDTSMHVTATPTGSAVGFYLAHGFRPLAVPIPELLAAEPDDIHLAKPLASS
jgi:GNAT superfamily N-acetyltransferase